MRFNYADRKYWLTGIVTSLPIWVGLCVIVLSFVLWNMQRTTDKKQVADLVSIQLRHVQKTLKAVIHNQNKEVDAAELKELFSGEHYVGTSMRLYKNNILMYDLGEENSLLTDWGATRIFKVNGDIWKIDLWPEAVLLKDYKTSLADLGLFMGLVVAVLLIIVGLLAMLATQREQVIQEAHRRFTSSVTAAQPHRLYPATDQKNVRPCRAVR